MRHNLIVEHEAIGLGVVMVGGSPQYKSVLLRNASAAELSLELQAGELPTGLFVTVCYQQQLMDVIAKTLSMMDNW